MILLYCFMSLLFNSTILIIPLNHPTSLVHYFIKQIICSCSNICIFKWLWIINIALFLVKCIISSACSYLYTHLRIEILMQSARVQHTIQFTYSFYALMSIFRYSTLLLLLWLFNSNIYLQLLYWSTLGSIGSTFPTHGGIFYYDLSCCSILFFFHRHTFFQLCEIQLGHFQMCHDYIHFVPSTDQFHLVYWNFHSQKWNQTNGNESFEC